MSNRMPVLFVSHGAPTFALEPGLAGPELTRLGQQLPEPRAIVVISAHWMTRGTVGVTTSAQPATIHDFGGFPAPLYALQYPAAGAPEIAARTLELLQQAGWPTTPDASRGLDHGAWVPLMHLYPDARIPVVQVSLPYPCDADTALRLGKSLAPLRDEGVLLIGSGSLTHNLYEIRHPGSDASEYVREFTDWTRRQVDAHDISALLGYRRLAPAAERAHPTEEHFLPLLVAAGATGDEEPTTIIDGGVDYGVLAMDTYVLGEFSTTAY
ncbi:dioxygenase [Corticimicrobacter populi]|uniref:Dioxygenase n=1 Tax=Corticimicrobacter populi TaxID=2175229 RepID=A0A2V1K0A6_9BURK|nr:class III extradiol ring-cleavage dioxygenase [Corticimicrobacter populi]PWF24626.1 dioxygenase [Corticimicrobacter populi]